MRAKLIYTPEAKRRIKKANQRKQARYDRLCGPVTVKKIEDKPDPS